MLESVAKIVFPTLFNSNIINSTKFDRVQITCILTSSYWLKPLTDEGGEETCVPLENPDRLKKYHILKPQNSSPKRDSNQHSSIGGRLGKLMH